ncbi:NACHT domain-containing protein [Phormidium tenue]|uniref:Uncharacterized protein n=1 Tax=Phormidium tenue NIES-30 TaxID=549789 RepID=A0A1U7IXR4_9CYAN|nr:NACHT domain-containing protein [Phormidium tenue]MBD2234985.1 NACHT domain-containing protein [Phormidium tenue FACHB-1052]OKH43150.1 hypothetical protein NIES30_25525 [Phormidium tenue NIES-30]
MSFLNRLGEIDFSHTIERLVEGFTGREWLFEKLDHWLNQEDGEKFYLLTGEPGVGKSAIAARLTQRWAENDPEAGKLAAYHFCRAGDVETVRPGRVVRSLAAQLVNTLPQYKEALKEVIDPVYLNINSEINIGTLSNSQVTGIYIENLKNLDPREEFRLLIQEPLATLSNIYASLGETLPSVKVLLIDSLDEAATTTGQENMVTLLALLYQVRETLPPWIRFLMTARPDQSVLTRFLPLQAEKIEELEAKNLSDIERYIQGRVDNQFREVQLIPEPQINNALVSNLKPLQQRLEEADLTAEKLVGEVKELSHGNFLYTKLLLNSIESGEQSIKNLSALPKNLNDIYHRILRYRCSFRGWLKRYQPILGVLSVAQEAITLGQLTKFLGIKPRELKQDLEVFQQFLDQSEDEQGEVVYSIFHQSLREYLLDKQNYDFWCDAKEQHENIISCYEQESESWQALRQIDLYGLRHLSQHLVQAEQVEQLHYLLKVEIEGRNAWFDLKDSVAEMAGFLSDVQLAWAKADEAYNHKPAKSIGLQCRYALIIASVNRLAEIPSELVKTLIAYRFWHPLRAISYAERILDPKTKCEVLQAIADALPDSEVLKFRVLKSALQAAFDIQLNHERISALAVLISHLPQTLLPNLLEFVATLDEYTRAEVWVYLLKLSLPEELLIEILEAVQTFQNKEIIANVLVVLVDRLPELLLPGVMETVLTSIGDYDGGKHCAKVLVALALRRSPAISAKLLKAALTIQKEYYRVDLLVALADAIPDILLLELLRIGQAIQNEEYLVKVLKAFAITLPKTLLSEVLKTIGTIQSEEHRADVLVAISNKLPNTLLLKVLEDIDSIQAGEYRVKALVNMADLLPESLLPNLLQIAQNVQNEQYRAQAMAGLIDKLPIALISEAFETIVSFENKFWQIDVLQALAYKLPELVLQKVLDGYITGEDFRFTVYGSKLAELISTLAKNLPETHLPQILEATFTILYEYNRGETLAILAERLPQALIFQVLEAALKIPKNYDSRAKVLIALINRIPEIAAQALEATMDIEDEFLRSKALVLLMSNLPKELSLTILEAILALKSESCRAEALIVSANKLPEVLLPQLLEATRTIQLEGRRADILTALIPKLPETLLPLALEVTITIEAELPLFRVLMVLADKLPNVVIKALEVAAKIGSTSRTEVSACLAEKIPQVLYPEALETVLEIQSGIDRAELLSMLIDKLPEPLLSRALEITLTIPYQEYRFKVLTVLAKKLPQSLLPQALAAAQASEDEPFQVRVLVALVEEGPEVLLPQALIAAQAIRNEEERINALITLVNQLPETECSNILEIFKTIKNERFYGESLVALAEKLPHALLPQVIEATLSIQHEELRANTLLPIVNNSTPSNLLLKALEVVQTDYVGKRICEFAYLHLLMLSIGKIPLEFSTILEALETIQDESCRAAGLTVLADYLPHHLINNALQIVSSIRHHDFRVLATLAFMDNVTFDFFPEASEVVLNNQQWLQQFSPSQEFTPSQSSWSHRLLKHWTLNGLINKMPSEILPKVVEILVNSQSSEFIFEDTHRAAILIALTDKIPYVLPQALDAALGVEHKSRRIEVLILLIDKLPNLLPQVLKEVLSEWSEYDRASMLIQLANKLPDAALPQILEAALSIQDGGSRAGVLITLIERLPDDLLSEVLESAQAIEESHCRTETLRALAVYLSTTPDRFKLWQKLLRSLSQRTRSNLLNDISVLPSVLHSLGGEDAILEAAQAVQDICRWWN